MVLAANTHRSDPDQAELSNYLLRHRRTRKKRKRNRKVSVGIIGSPIRAAWRELCIMDYALRMVVEKVAISSQEVIKRDTITNDAVQCPTAIGELGLRHTEPLALLETLHFSHFVARQI